MLPKNRPSLRTIFMFLVVLYLIISIIIVFRGYNVHSAVFVNPESAFLSNLTPYVAYTV